MKEGVERRETPSIKDNEDLFGIHDALSISPENFILPNTTVSQLTNERRQRWSSRTGIKRNGKTSVSVEEDIHEHFDSLAKRTSKTPNRNEARRQSSRREETLARSKDYSDADIDDGTDVSDIKAMKLAEELDLVERHQPLTGLKTLWSLVDPVWKLPEDELVELMSQRVIYESDSLIAFDKPTEMAYACAPADQAQFDRLLQPLKIRLCPNIDRLHLISSLDKQCSGVIMFAKSAIWQAHVHQAIADNDVTFRFRCLCKSRPKDAKARINIPLIKVTRGKTIKLCPLIGKAKGHYRNELLHLETDYKMVVENPSAYVSVLDAFEKRGLAQVVRSHFYYGLDCPVVGDYKYIRASLPHENRHPQLLHTHASELLGLNKNHLRRLPMFMHLKEVHLTEPVTRRPVVIRADLPPFFSHALKKLQLIIRK